MYDGAAKAWVWVRFRVKKLEQLQLTTNAVNSTIGKAKNFYGIQISSKILLTGVGFGVKKPYCLLLGELRPSQISVWAVAEASILLSTFLCSSSASFSRDKLFTAGWGRSVGCSLCHLVSGNIKTFMMMDSVVKPVVSHQKFLQPT